jgi:hypothetical protein
MAVLACYCGCLWQSTYENDFVAFLALQVKSDHSEIEKAVIPESASDE